MESNYTSKEIEEVLWNTFNLEAEAIEFTDDNNGNYKFNVFPVDDIKLGTLSDMAEELYETDLFDVTMREDHLEIEFLNPFVLERKQFRLMREALLNVVEFDDNKIKYYTKLYNTLQLTVQNNPFVKSVWNRFITKKKLSKKQWDELEYILKNGKTKYAAGILTTKN